MNSIFGFGGCIIECDGVTASFPNNTGAIRYQLKQQTWTTADNVERHKFQGWLPIISVQLQNLDDADVIQMHALINIINTHKSSGLDITITPRYSVTDEYGISFPVTLQSEFSPQDIAACEAGQTIELTFQATQIYQEIPAVFSGVTVYNLVDYAGNNVVDYAGYQVIVIN